jgi:alpha-galactosidase
MKRYTGRLIVIILVAQASLPVLVITLASCGGQAGKNIPDLQLQIRPVPGVYIQYDSLSSTFRIGNELIERRISVSKEKHLVFTAAFINKLSERDYIRSLSEESSFRANGMMLSGVTGDFQYVDHEIFGSGGLKGLAVTLRTEKEKVGTLRTKLVYEIYPHMPVIRKWIEIENTGGSAVTIDSVQVESLNLLPGSEYDVEVYTISQSPTVVGPGSTSALAGTLSPFVFDIRLAEGFLIGNEAPGALKHSDLYSSGSLVSIGMKPYYRNYATAIQLAPNEEFISPAAFILLFKGEPDHAEEALAKFVAEYVARSRTPEDSVWYENVAPDMTEPEAREKIQLAAKSGADIFCLDGSWMDKRGDWTINENAHFETLSQYAHGLGMKFGLCMELAVADPDSEIIVEYPQWIVKSKDGSDRTVGDDDSGKMMCLGSEYTLYVAYQIDGLVKELNLAYVKLTGPMIPDGETSGCFAVDHVHRSSAESLWYIYEGLFAICKYLHSQHPDLIIDVSPESYNPEGTIDYALLKHADVGMTGL